MGRCGRATGADYLRPCGYGGRYSSATRRDERHRRGDASDSGCASSKRPSAKHGGGLFYSSGGRYCEASWAKRAIECTAEPAVSSAGCEPYRMASGAGHDAMILAEKVPAVMIFLRTPGGISHDPAESVEVGDVAKAIDCGLHLLDQLASSSQFQRKTQHA